MMKRMHNDGHTIRVFAIFSAVSAVLFSAGYSIYHNASVAAAFNGGLISLKYAGLLSAVFLFDFVLLEGIYALLNTAGKVSLNHDFYASLINDRKRKRKVFFILWVLFILFYLPCYISYFPGIYSYDVPFSHLQIIGKAAWDNHQPVLHTLLWGLCYKTECITGVTGTALVTYSAIQIVTMTAIFAYIVVWLAEHKVPGWLCIVTVLFYALSPELVVFALIPTRDVLFSGAFIVWLTLLYDLLQKETREKRHGILMYLFGLLFCLLRNNGVYVIAVWLFIWLIYCAVHRKAWKNPGMCILCIILSQLVICGVIYPACGVQPVEKREAMSVPMSQLAAVYCNERVKLTEQEKEEILYYIPDAGAYNPRLADTIKYSFNEEALQKDMAGFIGLWMSTGKKHPVIYTDAFLNLNLPYWYPLARFPDSYSQKAYIETKIYDITTYKITRMNLLPRVNEFYESVAAHNIRIMNLPVTGYIFSLSMPFWFIGICIACACASKRNRDILCMLPLALLMGTYLLGPVSNFRYLYTFELALPICCGTVIIIKRK